MNCIFIQVRCRPGKTYEVADRIYEKEVVSELYSTSGEYDLLAKIYVPKGEECRQIRQCDLRGHSRRRPHVDHADVPRILTFGRRGIVALRASVIAPARRANRFDSIARR